jgi:hypothetical protein
MGILSKIERELGLKKKPKKCAKKKPRWRMPPRKKNGEFRKRKKG